MSTHKSFSTETSERYSRALFEVAQEASELEKIENDIKNFASLLINSLEIKNFIHNPTQSKDNQNKVLNLLAEKLNFSKNLKNFMFLLIEKRRMFFVEKIIDSFLKLCAQKRGEVKADMIIAISLQKGGRKFSFLKISSFFKISSGLFFINSFKVMFSGDNVW